MHIFVYNVVLTYPIGQYNIPIICSYSLTDPELEFDEGKDLHSLIKSSDVSVGDHLRKGVKGRTFSPQKNARQWFFVKTGYKYKNISIKQKKNIGGFEKKNVTEVCLPSKHNSLWVLMDIL